MTATYNHFGVPTTVPQPGEKYLDGGGVFYTDPEAHPFRVEYLRFEADSPLPEPIRTQCHAAFMVDDIQAAIGDNPVVLAPFEVFPGLLCAFIKDRDALIELMQTVPIKGCSCCG